MVRKHPAVLIVDDDEAICGLVRQQLTADRFDCDSASSGEDALRKLKSRSFDVILLDIKLSGMSGMDLLRVVEKRYPATAIIMMTALNDVSTAVEAMKLGASDYVVKPFTFGRINASINAVLEKQKANTRVAHTAAGLVEIDRVVGTGSRLLSAMNAIADGVQAQVDYYDFHSKYVTAGTIEMAERLGLPAEEIEQWLAARQELYAERDGRIKSALGKPTRHVKAQVRAGINHRSLALLAPTSESSQHGGESVE